MELAVANSHAQATVKVGLIGQKEPDSHVEACPRRIGFYVGEGNGPVDAFNNWLRMLLKVHEPLKGGDAC